MSGMKIRTLRTPSKWLTAYLTSRTCAHVKAKRAFRSRSSTLATACSRREWNRSRFPCRMAEESPTLTTMCSRKERNRSRLTCSMVRASSSPLKRSMNKPARRSARLHLSRYSGHRLHLSHHRRQCLRQTRRTVVRMRREMLPRQPRGRSQNMRIVQSRWSQALDRHARKWHPEDTQAPKP